MSLETLIEHVQAVARLTTMEVYLKETELLRDPSFFGEKMMMVVVPGKVGLGIELQDLGSGAVRQVGDLVVVTLPRPKVLYVEPDLAGAWVPGAGTVGG